MSSGTMEQRTEGMKRQAQELIEQAYQRGFKAGQENALVVNSDKLIEQGRNEVWEASRKIYLSEDNGGLPANEIRKIFNVEWYSSIIREFSASEVVAKLRAYEWQMEQEAQKEKEAQKADEEIKVGDEVILDVNSAFDTNSKAIVISKDGNVMFPYNVMIATGDTDWVDRDDISGKTGRTFPEIVEVLKKMQEDKA